MRTWITYGAGVLVSTGVALTGVLWHARVSPVTRAEDYAALLSAERERAVLGYHTGASTPVFVTNYVDSIPLWATIYGKIMCGSRAMATNVYRTLPAIFWLDATMPAPVDGDSIATCETQWFVSSVETNVYADPNAGEQHDNLLYVRPATNTADELALTCTRLPDTGKTFTPTWNGTNVPLSYLLYGTDSRALGFTWEHNNWWTRIGQGERIYLYGCETATTPDEVVTPSTPSFFSISPETRTFTEANRTTPQTYTVTSLSTSYAVLYADLIEVAAPGRASAWVVATDGASGVTNSIYTRSETGGSIKYTDVDEGATVRIRVRPYWTVYDGLVHYCEVSIVAQSGGFSVSWPDPGWTAPAYEGAPSSSWGTSWFMDVSAAEDSLKTDGGCIIRMTFLGQHSYFAVRMVDNDSGSPNDIEVNSSLLVLSKGGTDTFTTQINSPSTQTHLIAARQITTNKLWEASRVLTGLSRSVYICAWDSLTATACVGYDGRFNDFVEEETVNSPNAFNVDIYGGDVIAAVVETGEEALGWDGDLLHVYFEAMNMEAAYVSAPDTYYNNYVTATAEYHSRVLSGCTLPYPSEYACANGYVASVSVYAIARCYGATRTRPSLNMYEYSNIITFTGDSVQPNAYDDLSFGLGLTLCPILATTWEADTLATTYSILSYGDGAPPEMKLALIQTWEHPTARPSFTLGVREPDLSDILLHGCYAKYSSFGIDEDWRWEDKRQFRDVVSIEYFVVVVDWDWKHFGTGSFSTPANVPAWASGVE